MLSKMLPKRGEKGYTILELLIVIAIVAILIVVASRLMGCQGIKKSIKHVKSSLVGIEREVTLYADDGTVIRKWSGKFMVEVEQGGVFSWIGDDGREMKIMGTAIVEEVAEKKKE